MEIERMNEISGAVVDVAYGLYRELGPGLLEKVYEKLMVCELRRRGIRVERQKHVSFEYRGILFKDAFKLDLLVEDEVVVEVKSRGGSHLVFEKQLITYLRLSRKRLGLLVNYASPNFKSAVKRIANGL